ncbi:MAG: SPOR domain-containing protein [Hydrogenophaga sp.]|uniref:SPOR domain-containing protein n=1 Tax=Hydrogenophaga sp. TaxID=1904254 RepID=UPI0025C4BEB2|nr:SPOR domain-containing protein [Hydrogenophaga sp.]MBT9552775.1 SPOR domain-containing protein [Hydrogenophaga sp.]
MKLQATQARKHHGGTLTGFVVGLLVGLGVALSVAVYVTRVPVPFVDRGVSRKPAQDAAEAERNKGWNPNAGLAGKPAPLPPPPAAPEPSTEAPTPPVSDPATTKAEPAKPGATKPAADDLAKPAADPLGDLMKSKTGAAADPAAAGADPFAYFVQAGAFRSPEEAQAQKARLAMLGMDASVSEREQAGRTVYRVRMGPFGQKSMADATREQLEVNGVEAALVRVQR